MAIAEEAVSKIPISITKYGEMTVTENQLTFIKQIASNMVSIDEINSTRISICNRSEGAYNYNAIIHLPRMTTDTHALYRQIEIRHMDWANRDDKVLFKDNPWDVKRTALLVPLFRVQGKEFEIEYSGNLSRNQAVFAVESIARNTYVKLNDKMESIDCSLITYIDFNDNISSIRTTSRKGAGGCIFKCIILGDKLTVIEVQHWLS
jgi:hypothetical protein